MLILLFLGTQMNRFAALFVGLFLLSVSSALADDPAPSMNRAEWRSDLDFLYTQMQAIHPALHHKTDKATMDATVAELRHDISHMTWPQYVMGLYRLMALVGDGHTTFYPQPDAGPGFDTRYPILPTVFSDGVFITAADPAYADAVGGRIVAINGKPTADVFAAMTVHWDHENKMWPLRWFPFALRRPGYLAGMNIIPQDVTAPVTFTVEKNGARRDFAIAPVSAAADAAGLKNRWLHARDEAALPKPLVNPDDPFGFVFLKEKNTIYVAYNAVSDGEKETVAQFAKRLFAFADANKPDKLIFDLRNNGGGDNTLNQPLLLGMIKARDLDRLGHLFVLTSSQTFSAAQNFANQAERWTQALFVGEPTGSAPNLWGDANQFELPHTHLHPMVSTLYWEDSDPRDERGWIRPDIPAGRTFADWRAGRDPVLDAALDFKADESKPVSLPNIYWQRASQKGDWPLQF